MSSIIPNTKFQNVNRSPIKPVSKSNFYKFCHLGISIECPGTLLSTSNLLNTLYHRLSARKNICVQDFQNLYDYNIPALML